MNKDAGFSLMELMVVIMIIAIMAAITVPNVGTWVQNHRLSSTARDIYSMLQMSRLRAAKENANVAFSFNSSGYSAFVDNGRGGGIANDTIQNGTELTVFTGTFEGGVTYNGATVPQMAFDARGFPTAFGTTIFLSNSVGATKQVILSSAGNIRIQ